MKNRRARVWGWHLVRVWPAGLVFLALSMLGRGVAFAAPVDPSPHASPWAAPASSPPVAGVAPKPSLDDGLAFKQFAYGSLGAAGTMVLGLSLAVVIVMNDGQEAAETILGVTGWTAPLVAGMVVCRVGEGSHLYDGRCFPAVVGAYVGAVAMVPLGVLAIMAGCLGDNSSDEGCFTSIVGSLVLGLTIGPPVGALIGWNISKRPKPISAAHPPQAFGMTAPPGVAPPGAPLSNPWSEDLQRATRRDVASSGGLRLRVNLLSFSF